MVPDYLSVALQTLNTNSELLIDAVPECFVELDSEPT